MTPKEKYDARKAERKAREEALTFKRSEDDIRDDEIHDMADRFVTSIERIADALERLSSGGVKS